MGIKMRNFLHEIRVMQFILGAIQQLAREILEQLLKNTNTLNYWTTLCLCSCTTLVCLCTKFICLRENVIALCAFVVENHCKQVAFHCKVLLLVAQAFLAS